MKPIQVNILCFLIGCALMTAIWYGYTQHQANTEPDHSEYLKLIGGLKDDKARLEEKDKVKQDSLDSKDRRLNEKDSLLTISRTNNRTKYEKVYIYLDRISNDSNHTLFLKLYQ